MIDATRLALVFPGQASQSVGMMAGFAGQPEVKATFVEASAILGVDLWKMVTEGPAELLDQTVNTQPIMLSAGVATFRAWKALGGPDAAAYAGHSLGEYSALVAAGAIRFADALPLVRFRAEAMQSAVPEGSGGIAVITNMDESAVRSVCADAAQGQVLETANLNSPIQFVIAGDKAAVERGIILAKERGAKRAMPLAMSVPSHCSLMQPAAERLREFLRNITIQVPAIPVIQNADVTACTSADAIKEALVKQLSHSVRWIETVQALASLGLTTVAECAPGKVLTGLNKRIDGTLNSVALTDTAACEALLQQGPST